MNTTKLLLPAMISVALFGCGGGSGTTDTSAATAASVSLYVTDNLTLDYSEVWVTLYKVTTTDAAGQPVTLFDDPAGQVQNLRTLVGVGALLDSTQLPDGTYTGFIVTVGNAIDLVNTSGLISAQFDSSATAAPTFDIAVDGSLTVTAGQNTAAAIDFDLAQFTYDAASNQVSPVLVYQDPTQTDKLVRTYAEVEGTVLSISNGTQFEMTLESGGNVTVNLHSSAVVYNEADNSTRTDTRAMRVGGKVEVYGNFDDTTLALEAVDIKLDDGDESTAKLQEIEGRIESITGTLVTLNISDADFMPGTDSLSFDTSAVTFTKGSADLLATGMEIQVKGDWDANSSSFIAKVLEIEGAPRSGEAALAGEFAEISGTLAVDPTNGNFSLTVADFEHAGNVAIGDVLAVDFSNTWFKEGNIGCLLNGANLDLTGSVESGTLTVSIADTEDGCGLTDTQESPEAAGTIALGTVDLLNRTLQMTVTDVDNIPLEASPAIINIDFSAARFDNGLIDGLVANAAIEVEGSWDAASNTLTATELSFK